MSRRHNRGNKETRKEAVIPEDNISSEELAKSAVEEAEAFEEVKPESAPEKAEDAEGRSAEEAASEIREEAPQEGAEPEIKAEALEEEADPEIKAEALDEEAEPRIKVEALDEEETPEVKVETLEEMLAAAADDSRPVRKIEAVLQDPRAEDDTLEEEDESYQRNWREEPEPARGGGARKTVLILLILAAIIAIIAVAYKVVDSKKKQEAESSAAIVTETESPAAAESTAAIETTAAQSAAANSSAAESTEAAQITLEKDSNADISKLITDYYTALAAGDAEAVKALLDPSITIDENSITSQKDVVEAYQNIATYVTAGKAEGEYLVYTSYDMKFKDVKTAAPGLLPSYVKTQEDGSLKLIPYSSFDEEQKSYAEGVAGQKQVEDLAAKVNDAFTAAVNGDEDLAKIVASMNASGETGAAAAETTAASKDGAAETTAAETTVAETKAEKETKAAKEKFKEVDDIQYTTTQVKLRKKAVLDNDTNDFLLIDGGVWVHVVGISDHWAKVITQSGNTGYIYRDYLSVDKPGEVE